LFQLNKSGIVHLPRLNLSGIFPEDKSATHFATHISK